MHRVFISHASADTAIAERVRNELDYFQDVNAWMDRDLSAGTNLFDEISSRIGIYEAVVLIWSESFLGRMASIGGPAGLGWVEYEMRAAMSAKRRGICLILVRLDSTPIPHRYEPLLGDLVYVDLRARSSESFFKACCEVVGALRGVRPIYICQDILSVDDVQCFGNSWIGGRVGRGATSEHVRSVAVIDPDRSGDERVELQLGQKVPVVRYSDGQCGSRFEVCKAESCYWVAVHGFGMAASGWRTVDLRRYSEIRFNARASETATRLMLRLEDDSSNASTGSGHNQTSRVEVVVGRRWKAGRPFVVALDNFSWELASFPGNANRPDRSRIHQVTFDDDGCWPLGANWIEVKNLVIL